MSKWSKWLEPGEEILWSQLLAGPEQATTGAEHEAVGVMLEVLSMVLNFVSLCLFVKAIVERGIGNFFWYALLILAIAWGVKWFAHTQYGKKLKTETNRNIFQNGIITDRRAVFFNHYSQDGREFRARDIEGAVIDFENGGRALRIIPSVRRKRVVLVGNSDFQQAVNIINSHLLLRKHEHEHEHE